jgi:hypothetical protein
VPELHEAAVLHALEVRFAQGWMEKAIAGWLIIMVDQWELS